MPLNALIGGSIVERFGRKATIMATGPPYILCKLLIPNVVETKMNNFSPLLI